MSLSQKQFADFRKVCKEFNEVEEIIKEELIHEICDELIEELIEEGYSEEEAIEVVDEATDLYIDETLCEVSDSYYDSAVRASKKSASGIDKAARQKRRAGRVRYAKRKAGEVFKRGKELVGAAKAGAALAKDFAGDELRRAGRKAVHSATKAADTVKSAPGKAKDKAKKGIKGIIGRVAKKVASKASGVAKRMAEELKSSGKFSEKEIAAILESENQVDEAMSSYDRNRKRAAQRAADRNAARAAGKTGVVPGVGYVSPRKERETYVDSAGTTRHKSGAKMPKD